MIEPGNVRSHYPMNPESFLVMDAACLLEMISSHVAGARHRAINPDKMQPISPGDARELQDRCNVVMQQLDIMDRIIRNYNPNEVYDSH